jgi:hypothetical protein
MTMPKTAMHKNDLFLLAKDEIWSAGQIPAMQPISEAETEHTAAYDQFNRRVLTTNTSHVVTAVLWGELVH